MLTLTQCGNSEDNTAENEPVHYTSTYEIITADSTYLEIKRVDISQNDTNAVTNYTYTYSKQSNQAVPSVIMMTYSNEVTGETGTEAFSTEYLK